MLSVEKVYDELYGMIEDLKKKIAALSSGDEVTITPALESGTKIADYTIGEDEGVIYAPTPIPLNISTTEEKIGTYDGKDLYARLFKGKTINNTGWTNDICGTSDIEVVDYGGYVIASLVSGKKFPLNVYFTAEANIVSTITNNNADMRIQATLPVATYGTLTADIYLLYTKVEPEPEPEAKKTRKK